MRYHQKDYVRRVSITVCDLNKGRQTHIHQEFMTQTARIFVSLALKVLLYKDASSCVWLVTNESRSFKELMHLFSVRIGTSAKRKILKLWLTGITLFTLWLQ